MSKKVLFIDYSLCLNCQTCTILDPQTFKNNPKKNKVEVIKQPVSVDKINTDTKAAIESCPQNAIKINH
jgi:ferredoxin